jgi:hypothetical protein
MKKPKIRPAMRMKRKQREWKPKHRPRVAAEDVHVLVDLAVAVSVAELHRVAAGDQAAEGDSEQMSG